MTESVLKRGLGRILTGIMTSDERRFFTTPEVLTDLAYDHDLSALMDHLYINSLQWMRLENLFLGTNFEQVPMFDTQHPEWATINAAPNSIRLHDGGFEIVRSANYLSQGTQERVLAVRYDHSGALVAADISIGDDETPDYEAPDWSTTPSWLRPIPTSRADELLTEIGVVTPAMTIAFNRGSFETHRHALRFARPDGNPNGRLGLRGLMPKDLFEELRIQVQEIDDRASFQIQDWNIELPLQLPSK